MAVSPPPIPDFLPPLAGFRLAVASCGIKNGRRERDDLLLVEMAPETTVAGLFTRNRVQAAPVVLSRQRLAWGRARGLLVNSGNANAVTGEAGMRAALETSALAAHLIGADEHELFVASTGVIGTPLPVEQIVSEMPGMVDSLAAGGWERAARAIMTTDTFPKLASRECRIGAESVRIIGMTKGAGMIRPDMATMLAFLFTDADIASASLRTLLNRAVAGSFNAISVDGDQSTNDTMLLFASGRAGNGRVESADDPRLAEFAQALHAVCRELAQAIVRDGEGASKFVTLTVSGAAGDAEAKQVAMAIANSPLVKTALAGSDPNWGRILAAAGYAGVGFDPGALSLWLGEVLVVERGQLANTYEEARGAAVMAAAEIAIRLDLGGGAGTSTVWTCDLTHDYITINADYRT
ncbi:Glutamate N-acetyltransferase/amino-acid [Candidatus Magnetaquicoccaceae bacterium FCR-1]|uniref:Arginine biosynthesis bifunctional protein ArgJ n=1 Tax=Candidatus Magnetaquiglobus chichijimensis TaxID=3141448 RepID=A0ABQ0CAQ9_9PROT